jgi:hypothetical protein
MHICYLDDSGDEKVRAFCLISVPVLEWHRSFQHAKNYRRTMRERHGIYVTKELHATEFVGGRGRISAEQISKETRVRIYNESLSSIVRLPGVRLFNAIAPKRSEYMLFERLLNRVNRAMKEWDSHALLISDEGKDYNRLVRKMGVYNPIPSQFGGATRNVVLNRIVDEILYKRSQDSHFIQIADFCAYALLRSEVHLPSKNALGLHRSFERLIPMCQTQCYARDPRKLGIIRA